MNKQKITLILLLIIVVIVYQLMVQTDVLYNYPLYVLLGYGFYLLIKYYKEII